MEDRTLTDIIIKTLALHVAVVASASHLVSLQPQSKHHYKSTLWQIVWFIAVLIYSIVLLVDRVVACADLARQKGFRSANLRYCVAYLTGVYAELQPVVQKTDPDTVALLSVGPEDVPYSVLALKTCVDYRSSETECGLTDSSFYLV
jgi:hypothetical protein